MLKNDDKQPTVTYKLGKTIRNKISNYKEAVNSIYVDGNVSFYLITVQCDCTDTSFCDPHHKHTITGDLRIDLRITPQKGSKLWRAPNNKLF